jgi:hypothetical protein
MNTSKLSLNTKIAISNNFGFPKGENGTIGAIVKVNKNIDKELKDLGASIQGLMQGQTTGEIISIRFPINSLDKISNIDGLVYLDTGYNEKIGNLGVNLFASPSITKPIATEPKKNTEVKTKYKSLSTVLLETTPMLVKASIVPIGLYVFSKYKKYDTKKTLKVTIIGSVVILGAVVINGFSGAWSGVSLSDKLIANLKSIGEKKEPSAPRQKIPVNPDGTIIK